VVRHVLAKPVLESGVKSLTSVTSWSSAAEPGA
jgi:hypothetical protein